MVYQPKNSDRYLVFNPKGQTLIEKIESSISAFHLAVKNNLHFRINDTDGVQLVEYFTSITDWWNRDWEYSEGKVVDVDISHLHEHQKRLLKTNSLLSEYKDCNVIHLNGIGNFSGYLKDLKYSNQQIFDYLFEVETILHDEYQEILDRVIYSQHIFVNLDDLNVSQVKRYIDYLINDGKKVFFSSSNLVLINQLTEQYPKSVFKTLTSSGLTFDTTYNFNDKKLKSIIFQLLLMRDISPKIISNKKITNFLFGFNHTIQKENIDHIDLYKINI